MDKVMVISISLDREIQTWKKEVLAEEALPIQHFLMINPDSSYFIKQHTIEALPRYLMFDQEGKLISHDVPNPSSPLFRSLLERHLK